MSRPGTGTREPLCATQFSCSVLRSRHLEVAPELQLAVDDVEDRVGAPLPGIGRPASRTPAAAPLVGEDDLGAVVVERGRVPVGEAGVDHLIDADGGQRVGDIEQDAVAGARTRGQADIGIRGDVVALYGFSRALRAGPVVATPPQTREGARIGIRKDEWSADDVRLFGSGHWNLDDVDTEERRVRIVSRAFVRTAL